MTLKEQIQDAENRLAAALKAQDSKSIASMYTESARLLPHGAPTLSGREQIGAFFEQAFGQGIVAAKFTALEVDGSEQQAIEIGKYELFAQPTPPQQVTAVKGRYLVVWMRIGNEWMLHRDIFNDDSPAS